MPRVVHFEIHADDMERAANFYRHVFGWTISKWDGPMEYWMVMTGEGKGIDGGLVKRHGHLTKGSPPGAFVCTIEVDSIDRFIEKVKEHGGHVAMEKFDIAGMAWQCYCTDTEGNIFGLHEPIKKGV